MILSPNDGGCWFCYTDQGEMVFSTEFDCYLHLSCLQKEMTADPTNREAKIMAREFAEELNRQ